MSRKVGTGGGGWVHSQGANSMAASGLGCRDDLVGPFGINGLRNKPSHLVRPQFPVIRAHFSAMTGWHLPLGALNASLLSGGCG